MGGDHGKLKHGPPEGHSPVYESLLPKQKFKIKPCVDFGDATKGILYGPAEITDLTPFVPKPVDTNQVSSSIQ